MSNFSATIDEWCLEEAGRLEAVFKKSAERVAEEVKGLDRMPVKTGFLRRSLLASTAALPSIDPKSVPVDGTLYPDNQGEVSLVINGASLGDTIFLGFTAAYARRLEYGFTGADSLGRSYNQTGKGFVRLTAQRWPEIVAEVVATAKGAS